MLAMKGVHPYDEIARLPATHRVAGVEELRIPGLEAKRHLVILEPA
jgi:16S rRNA (guanine527-N7)-methyltransferase